MILSVQAEGMGGATLAYPLDAPSAYHQPAIRTAIGSRFDLQGGSKNVSGFGINQSFCSWLAGGIDVFEKEFEAGVAVAFRSQAVGISSWKQPFCSWLVGGMGMVGLLGCHLPPGSKSWLGTPSPSYSNHCHRKRKSRHRMASFDLSRFKNRVQSR